QEVEGTVPVAHLGEPVLGGPRLGCMTPHGLLERHVEVIAEGHAPVRLRPATGPEPAADLFRNGCIRVPRQSDSGRNLPWRGFGHNRLLRTEYGQSHRIGISVPVDRVAAPASTLPGTGGPHGAAVPRLRPRFSTGWQPVLVG